MEARYGARVTLTLNAFTKEGSRFTGWKVQGEETIYESITFTLPVGTTYSLGESAAQNYNPAVVVTATSGEISEELKREEGSLSKALMVEGLVARGIDNNSAAFTNTYTEPENPLPGIIEKNGPFLILILVAVLGFAFYLADRRKARR